MINKIYVHNGVFHCDDVMCVALMKYINPNIEVERTNFPPKEYNKDDVIVADIGYGKYDHHQSNVECRSDGKPHAACGLVFKDFWKQIFPNEESARLFNKKYIIPIENQDNGVAANPLSAAIFSFNPTWDIAMDTTKQMECFNDAVNFMIRLIKNEIAIAHSKIDAENIVNSAIMNRNDKKYIVLHKYVPYNYYLQDTDVLYVIFPSNRVEGNWNVLAVNDESVDNSFNNRKLFPSEWKENDKKPEGLTFLHDKLFMASFDNLDHAISGADYAVNA